jgi:hypothetical protein
VARTRKYSTPEKGRVMIGKACSVPWGSQKLSEYSPKKVRLRNAYAIFTGEKRGGCRQVRED